MARRVLGADSVVGAAGAFVALSAHRATKGLFVHIWAVRWRGTTPTDPARASPAPKSRFKAREKHVAYLATAVALRQQQLCAGRCAETLGSRMVAWRYCRAMSGPTARRQR